MHASIHPFGSKTATTTTAQHGRTRTRKKRESIVTSATTLMATISLPFSSVLTNNSPESKRITKSSSISSFIHSSIVLTLACWTGAKAEAEAARARTVAAVNFIVEKKRKKVAMLTAFVCKGKQKDKGSGDPSWRPVYRVRTSINVTSGKWKLEMSQWICFRVLFFFLRFLKHEISHGLLKNSTNGQTDRQDGSQTDRQTDRIKETHKTHTQKQRVVKRCLLGCPRFVRRWFVSFLPRGTAKMRM